MKNNKVVEVLNRTIKEMESIGMITNDISDGSHTFSELYYDRMVLFSIICETYKDFAWKSLKHSDGIMYKDYFVVGIDTPKGQFSYHYHVDYWNYFSVKVLDFAPEWDGHTTKDIDRLFELV